MQPYHYAFKYIIVGDTNVGKSCLLLQFTKSDFNNQHDATIGLEFGTRTININDKLIRLRLWDSAGQEHFHSLTKSYYRGGSIGGLLVYDVSNRKSFDNISLWYSDLKDISRNHNDLVLVGNKIDQEKREVPTDEGMAMAKKLGMVYIETSAKTGENVYELFYQMSQRILSKIIQSEIDPNLQGLGINIGQLSLKTSNQNKIESKQINGQSRCC